MIRRLSHFLFAVLIVTATQAFAQSSGPNVYETFEGGINGQALSVAALNAGLVCNNAGGSWSFWGNGTTQMQFSSAASAPIATSMTACGTVFNPYGSLGVTYNLNTGSTGFAKYSWAANSNNASLGAWFMTDLPTSDPNYHSMLTIWDNSSEFASLMIHNGYFYLETGANPNRNPDFGSFFPYVAGKWYWVTLHFQTYVSSSSMQTLAIYDCGTRQAPVLPCTQVSLQKKYAASYGTTRPSWMTIGKVGDTGTPANLVYYDEILADTTGQTFPILPASGSTKAPGPPSGLRAVAQ